MEGSYGRMGPRLQIPAHNMKYFQTFLLVVLVVSLSLSAFNKVLVLPGELEFYSGFGFSSVGLSAFGVQQLVCIALLLFPPSRFMGGAIAALNFAGMGAMTIGSEFQFLLIWLIPTSVAGVYLFVVGLRGLSKEAGA